MGGGGLTPKTRLPLIGQRGSGRKAEKGGGSRLDRKNRFRDGKPRQTRQERVLGTQSGFCSREPVAVWEKGATQGKDIHPNAGKGPRQHLGRGTAGQRFRWPRCSLLLHVGPTFPHLDSGHNTIPTMLGAFMRIKCTRPGICKVLSQP